MTDDPGLLAAVAADPDDDLPRLVYADWLDEHGQPDRAEFIRAQVRLAQTPAWEPFAVFCRHRRAEWTTGDPWRMTLPPTEGYGVEWHPDTAFRRGFGWSVLVRDLNVFLETAPWLFDAAPVGQLHLPTATLDQWRAFARGLWLPRVKSIHFYGTMTPNEPVRVLCESDRATGLEEIVFEVTSRPGMPEVLRTLLAAPLGRRLKRLELRAGPFLVEDVDELYGTLSEADPHPELERLAIINMSAASRDATVEFNISPVIVSVQDFTLAQVTGATPPLQFSGWPNLSRFAMPACDHGWSTFSDFTRRWLTSPLRSLDLSLNPIAGVAGARQPSPVDRAGLPLLRSLALRRTGIDANILHFWLTRASFWPNLAELDLRDNAITDAGARHLLASPVPPDLTALLLVGNPISDGMKQRLHVHFGECVIL